MRCTLVNASHCCVQWGGGEILRYCCCERWGAELALSTGNNFEAFSENSLMLGQPEGSQMCHKQPVCPKLLGPLLMHGPVQRRSSFQPVGLSLRSREALVSSKVCALAALHTWLGTAGGACRCCCCCWGFLEKMGRMMVVVSAALQMTY